MIIQTPVSAHGDVAQTVLRLVGAATGYDIAELSAPQDLEHDLGIDSLKRLDILLGLSQEFGVLEEDPNALPRVRTIQDLIDLVVQHATPDTAPVEPLAQESLDPGRPIEATEDELARVTRSVADLRNYESEWLAPELSLIEDLGLNEAERQQLAETLGIAATHCVGTLRSLAESLKRPVDEERSVVAEQLAVTPPETCQWTLAIGTALPDAADLGDVLVRALEADGAPLIEVNQSNGTHAFAVLVDRGSATWQSQLRAALAAAAGRSHAESNVWWSEEPAARLRARRTAWLFPGSGSLYAGFLDELTGLSENIAPLIAQARSTFSEITGGQTLEFSAQTDPLIQRPATVVASAVVAGLLGELSGSPDLVAGHSVGELTACHVAGGLDLTALVQLTAAPFLGPEPYPQGKMLALLGSEDQTRHFLADAACDVVVSNRNSRTQLVVSGPSEAIGKVEHLARERGIAARLLDVAVPYHSPLLAPAHARFRTALDQVNLAEPRIPIVSGLTGEVLPWSSRETAQTRALLDCAFIAPVNFVGQIERLVGLGAELLIDIGPTNRLTRLAKETIGADALVLSANGSPHGSRHAFLSLLAQLHTLGQPVHLPQRRGGPVLAKRPTLMEPVAVVGLGGIMPDAEDIETFWAQLLNGHYAIRDLPQDAPYRWPLESYYDADPEAIDKTSSRIGAVAPDVAFKPIQFRIPPNTAAHMDRGQKMALLATRAALSDSGIDRAALDPTRVRVVIGTSVPEMQDISRPRLVFDEVMAAIDASPAFSGLPAHVRAQVVAQAREVVDARYLATNEDSLAGSIPNVVAGRVALCFDIRGGNVTLDAACASSLAALDHAIKCLRLGEVDLVIAGGVDFAMSAASYVGFSKATALSATGSNPFDSRANGFVMGEGAGMLVLERLSDAQQAGRKIYAVLRAVGTASDGSARNITAPSVEGQVGAMRAALAESGIDPSSIGYIEAHGTSTVLGDVTEFQSLQRVFGETSTGSSVYLGSVKANIGHLKAAAGIAGLIKAALAVQSGDVPPMPNFVSPAAGVDLERSPLVINQSIAKLNGRGATPRRALVDSFGFGGVNYSAIVEQYRPEFYTSEEFHTELLRSSLYRRHYAPYLGTSEVSQQASTASELQNAPDVDRALRSIGQPLAVVDHAAGALRVCTASSAWLPTSGTAAVRGWVPAIRPEDLGAPGFRRRIGVRFNYLVGEMAGGIASVDLVVAAARSGMLAFFGSGGLDLVELEAALTELKSQLGDLPFGVNLLHNAFDPNIEERTVDLLLRREVRIVSASAFLGVTPAVVRYRATGMRRAPDGQVIVPNTVVAKISAPRVAEQFLSPPPAELLRSLVATGQLSEDEASAAALVPVAEALTAEGDSGGHTDGRPLAVLFPQINAVREAVGARHDFGARGIELYVGVAGGIGDPASMRAAFALGADYVLTGTINQTTREARTSDRVKHMLAEAGMEDVAMAPAADMFESGAQVQVLKRGTLYAQRARLLYELYHRYAGLDELPRADRERLEREVFHRSLDEVWTTTLRYWAERDPDCLARSESDPKLRMALVFRSYLGLSSRWATGGDEARRSDYQVWCGPAIGVFNSWIRGTWLESLDGRGVVDVGLALLYGTCVLSRREQLAQCGYRFPPRKSLVAPPPAATLRQVLL